MGIDKKIISIMFLLKDIKYDARVQKEARTLAENGYEVVIFYISKFENQDFNVPGVNMIAFEKNQVYFKNLSPKKRLLYILTKPFRVLQNMLAYVIYICFVLVSITKKEKGKKYIFHCHDLPSLPVGIICSLKLGGSIIYDSHELYPEMSGRGKFEKWFFTSLERLIIKQSTVVFAANEPRAKIMAERYRIGVPEVIKNYPCELLGYSSKRQLREELNISEDHLLIIYIGGLQSGRGLDNLVDAMNLVIPSASLVLIGFGSLGNSLKKKVNLAGLSDRINILPPISPSEINNLLKQADLGVNLYENISLNNWLAAPNKLYDYVQAGVPVLAGDQPGIGDEVKEHGIGVLCNPSDHVSIADAINTIIKDRALIQKMRLNCQEKKHIFSWSTQEKVLLGIYNKLSNEGRIEFCKEYV